MGCHGRPPGTAGASQPDKLSQPAKLGQPSSAKLSQAHPLFPTDRHTKVDQRSARVRTRAQPSPSRAD
eukprot:1438334-Heterocapsa_arctica.AAC.1